MYRWWREHDNACSSIIDFLLPLFLANAFRIISHQKRLKFIKKNRERERAILLCFVTPVNTDYVHE